MTTREDIKASDRFKTLAHNYRSHQLGNPTWKQMGRLFANQVVKYGWYEAKEFDALARRICVMCEKPSDAAKAKDQLNLISRGWIDEHSRVRLVVQMLFFFRQEDELFRRDVTEERGGIFADSYSLDRDEYEIFDLVNWQQYFNWDFFQDAIRGQQMPAAWQNMPSTRALRPPFSDVDSPVVHREPLNLNGLFADECLEIASARIAHTPFDKGPRWPSNIMATWDDTNDYEIPILEVRRIRDWMFEKYDSDQNRFTGLLRNGEVVRLRSCSDDGEGGLLLDLHRTYYFSTICTNEMVQYNARLRESNEAAIDLLLPKDQDGNRWLGALDNALSNHVGITAVVLTRDGFPLMYHRPGKQHMNPDRVGLVTSSVWGWEPNFKPHDYLLARSMRETGMDWAQLAWIPESPDDDRISSILYLGATREWSRGGKPELFYLVLSKHSLDEHIEHLRGREAHSSGVRNQKVRSGSVIKSHQLRLCREGYLGNAAMVTLGIERLLELGEVNGIELEEPAKAGLYLLRHAYLSPRKAILEEFYRQHEIQFVPLNG